MLSMVLDGWNITQDTAGQVLSKTLLDLIFCRLSQLCRSNILIQARELYFDGSIDMDHIRDVGIKVFAYSHKLLRVARLCSIINSKTF